ncbi:hypothetical protein HPB49_006103 [Dermacentor silvarum]|uniref:Uncharacterized protein n=1 Tax=Dermacentor silvarum TaxID=543639 RepID=A0ACB8DW92_DERSI|nr:hypothetical protein HPB49_006103 [Dermacentor silvarum]
MKVTAGSWKINHILQQSRILLLHRAGLNPWNRAVPRTHITAGLRQGHSGSHCRLLPYHDARECCDPAALPVAGGDASWLVLWFPCRLTSCPVRHVFAGAAKRGSGTQAARFLNAARSRRHFGGVVGCSNRSDSSRRKKPTNTNFFRIPSIVVDRCERSKTLSTNRRTLWLARINRVDLDPQNPNLRVCGAHFVTGPPSDFFVSTNPDWDPSLHLGYSIRQTDADRYERREQRRQRKRRQRKTGVCTPDNLAANRAV